MAWWGRRKSDPPTGKPAAFAHNVEPPGAASEPSVFTPSPNVVPFPDQAQKKLSDANRAAVHALLDELLDQIGENEYLVMGIEEPE